MIKIDEVELIIVKNGITNNIEDLKVWYENSEFETIQNANKYVILKL